MDYEKKYKEALERAKHWMNEVLPVYDFNNKEALVDIFPELKKSKDEKIRKTLTKIFEIQRVDGYGIDNSEILDWLDKQKPIEIQPIFETGDVMRTKGEAAKGFVDGMPVVVSIDEEYYHCNNESIPIKRQYDYEYPPINKQQKPVEWSEKDREMIDRLIGKCERTHKELCNDKYGHQEIVSDLKRDCIEELNWLESLKQKIGIK